MNMELLYEWVKLVSWHRAPVGAGKTLCGRDIMGQPRHPEWEGKGRTCESCYQFLSRIIAAQT